MIYHKPNLVVKILFESFRKKPISGAFRPHAYIKATGKYSSVCRFNLFKSPIEKGDERILNIIIESPVGFGSHLEQFALLSIREGFEEIGKAVVLEITGYLNEIGVE